MKSSIRKKEKEIQNLENEVKEYEIENENEGKKDNWRINRNKEDFEENSVDSSIIQDDEFETLQVKALRVIILERTLEN